MRHLTLRSMFSHVQGDTIYRDNNGVLEFFDGAGWTESIRPGNYDDLVAHQNDGLYTIVREYEA